ncbi:hypothetical protein PHLCEN_2v2358 [Hermanssonia centrifuga]|uniref:NADP-dependent oxidoreductase domain-containing protein n=1 Tax=Hermanssonia centrifuga TaxID=98765 RepID=A0A2R6RM62_9APHY|nr:hypothetical protein PHLCEN_2v2358 [Hermanssonia centrifuga]
MAAQNGYRHLDTVRIVWAPWNIHQTLIHTLELLGLRIQSTDHHRVQEGLEESLKKLDCEYIDLYLMHWPQAVLNDKVIREDEHPTYVNTWKEMEKLLDTGKVKSIGVSNFSIKTLEVLLPQCTIIPATNQVELHPCLPQFGLKEYCDSKGILLTAYSPFGQGNPLFFKDPDFIAVAENHKATVAQVAVSWAVQRGTVPIPKSANVERMKANITLIKLTPEEMQTINDIHKKPGMHRSLLAYHASDGTFFDWTYEQLGWPMSVGGFVTA